MIESQALRGDDVGRELWKGRRTLGRRRARVLSMAALSEDSFGAALARVVFGKLAKRCNVCADHGTSGQHGFGNRQTEALMG